MLLSENIIEDTKVCRLDEWVLHGSNNNGSSNNPVNNTVNKKADNLKLWQEFIEAVEDFILSRPDASEYKVEHKFTGNDYELKIFEDITLSVVKYADVVFRFNMETEVYEVCSKHYSFSYTGTGFTNMVSEIDNCNFHIFRYRGNYFNCYALKKLASNTNLNEWVLHNSNNNGSSNNPTTNNNLKLWQNFVVRATVFVKTRPDSKLFYVDNFADPDVDNNMIFQIEESVPNSRTSDVIDYYISFYLDTGEYLVGSNAGPIPDFSGTGFNNMIDDIIRHNFAPFSFQGQKLDLKSLKESYSTIDDFKKYEDLWD